jgi:radical SAM superfamily enzyme YgiQ (UPF0313 family)
MGAAATAAQWSRTGYPGAVSASRSPSRPLRVVLIATYELGHQPFNVASAAAWLREAGHTVTCQDLSRTPLRLAEAAAADLLCFHLPMHTATRLALRAAAKIRAVNPAVPLCFFGLYAPLNAPLLEGLGGSVSCLGGEFEAGLTALATALATGAASGPDEVPLVSTSRLPFRVPDRGGLPTLDTYSRLQIPDGTQRIAGYTEASRGCKHHCRHCPVVPVYEGRVRLIPPDVVLGDIHQQVAAGARHITFGDPDFFNAVPHACAIVEALHRDHPDLTYDVTIKVTHLLDHADHLARLKETGCLFVTSAMESTEDAVLARLAKDHTRADLLRVVEVCRAAGLPLAPTFVPFTPWTTLDGYLDLLTLAVELDLVAAVAPVQYSLRLLIPAGSRLLDLPETREVVGSFDPVALVHPWRHPEAAMDVLQERVMTAVTVGTRSGLTRGEIFTRIWHFAHRAARRDAPPLPASEGRPARATIPYLQEPWYC